MSPKQARLVEYCVVVAPITISSGAEESSKLTAATVKFEPAIYALCCLCNRWAVLRFCMEYLNGEGDIVLWGETCPSCRNRVIAEKAKRG